MFLIRNERSVSFNAVQILGIEDVIIHLWVRYELGFNNVLAVPEFRRRALEKVSAELGREPEGEKR